MTRCLLVLLALVAKPWVACHSGLPYPDGSTTTARAEGHVAGRMPLPTSTTSSTTTLGAAILSTLFLQASGRFMPTDRPPTVPLPAETENHEAIRKLGAYYRTVYTGANFTTTTTTTTTTSTKRTLPSPRVPGNGNFSDSETSANHVDDVIQPLNQSHINRESSPLTSSSRDDGVPTMTTSSPYNYEDVEKVPWHQGHTHHKTHRHHKSQDPEHQQPPPPEMPEKVPTEKAGPYFRPPSAISHKYKNFRVEEGQDLEDIDPDCWPHCHRNSTRGDSGSKRKRKHSSNKKRKYYNYKLLYDTLKGDLRRQETEFYAWIFGATMLTLGSLTTLTSCFVFCFCSEKWRKRRQTKRYDKSGQYQRVDSVSSVVDSHHESQDHHDQLDSVTII